MAAGGKKSSKCLTFVKNICDVSSLTKERIIDNELVINWPVHIHRWLYGTKLPSVKFTSKRDKFNEYPMELDVKLTRCDAKPWGFRLIGGLDFKMPLTVVKVQPESAAEHYGLQDGDTLVSINGLPTDAMTHESAHDVIIKSTDHLILSVTRGPFDGLQEAGFQPIHTTQDIVHDLLPSEVPDDTRSNTASPFLLPTKPYRPFSTEPLNEIPPIEDPIILNPDYHDEFPEFKPEDFPKETVFKLPKSPHYVSEKDRAKCKVTDAKVKKEVKEETVETFKEITATDFVKEKMTVKEMMTVEEIKYMEQMKKELDLTQIEETASHIVDESLEKAVIVTEEIKKEISIELNENNTESTTVIKNNCTLLQENISESTNIETNVAINSREEITSANIIENISKETIEISRQNNVVNIEESKLDQTSESKELIAEVTKEIIDNVNVSLDKTNTVSFEHREKGQSENRTIDKTEATEEFAVTSQETHQSMDAKEFLSTQQKVSTHTIQHEQKDERTKKNNSNKKSTSKLLAEQRSYILGLQTIPNIKGRVHSSFHYDLLLKTFFIHLTDVMVALSRFILAEPLSKSSSKEDLSEQFTETITRSSQEDVFKTEAEHRIEQTVVQTEDQTSTVNNNSDFKHVSHETLATGINAEDVEKRKLSGSKMAQLTGKKSEELIQNMGAVVTEFETKLEAHHEQSSLQVSDAERSRRSRSRSQIEEEVAKESDPLEWLSKIDENKKTIQVTSESKLSHEIEVSDAKHTESKKSREIKESAIEQSSMTTENITGANTYIAIVEAHVYTNKDAIINASTETVEEINLKTIEATKMEEEEQSIENVISENVVDIVELKEDSSELTLQEAIAKSNIAIITCEQITQEDPNVDQENVTINLKTEENIEIQIEDVVKDELISQKESCLKNEHDRNKSTETTKFETIHVTDFEDMNDNVELKNETKTVHNLEEVEEMAAAYEKASFLQRSIEESSKAVLQSSTETIQEASFTARSTTIVNTNETVELQRRKLSLDIQDETLNIKQLVQTEENNNMKTLNAQYTNITNICNETMELQTRMLSLNKQDETVDLRTQVQRDDNNIIKAQSTNISNESMELERRKLTLNINKDIKEPLQSEDDIKTPTPSTIPPTPLTDEYVFRLQIPLAVDSSTAPAPKDPTPEPEDHEDPHIVKKKLIPYIETTIESLVYDKPLASPSATKTTAPAFIQHGLESADEKVEQKSASEEEILEIERKSSLLASAINETIKSIEEYKEQVGIETPAYKENSYEPEKVTKVEDDGIYIPKSNGYASETIIEKPADKIAQVAIPNILESFNCVNQNGFSNNNLQQEFSYEGKVTEKDSLIKAEIGIETTNVNGYHVNEIIGTTQGIINGVEGELLDNELAKELGKPGMTEDKIAELISGESEMLREAHVMGLKRVLASHMSRPNDDSSVDFKKIKPIIENLKDSEVLKALNAELIKTVEEKKQEERKWTKFLQKPSRPVPKSKFGYYSFLNEDLGDVKEPYKVKIVKQPKPKVAPDYKPEDFETGLLPWEERAANEPPPPPVPREEPILVPEELPEYLEAVDPLPESEVPDLEDTGIPLPQPIPEKAISVAEEPADKEKETNKEELEKVELEIEKVEVTEDITTEEMENTRIAEEILGSIQNMVDPNATLEQQLVQMRAQIAALAQLPGVIQQTLELVTRQITNLSVQETTQVISEAKTVMDFSENVQVTEDQIQNEQETVEENQKETTTEMKENVNVQAELVEMSNEEIERMRIEEQLMIEEQKKLEIEKREMMEQLQLDQESRQLKQRPTPRVGRPKPAFGPLVPQERPLVLPGGRKWRKPKDAYNEEFIAETLTAQAELIQGKAKGLPYESAYLPYDERESNCHLVDQHLVKEKYVLDFEKIKDIYEKPPVSLDHLKNSDVYKLIHNMDESPMRRVDMLTHVVAESDYREKCRSVTPCVESMTQE